MDFELFKLVNPFLTSVPILGPLKAPENLLVFSGSTKLEYWPEIGQSSILVSSYEQMFSCCIVLFIRIKWRFGEYSVRTPSVTIELLFCKFFIIQIALKILP